MRILVTGATSMLGIATIEAALKSGTEIFAIIRPNSDRKKRLPAYDKLHVIETDITRLKETGVMPVGCDCFYHFAWKGTNKIERDNPLIQEENIRYTLDAVQFAHKCGCKTFVGAGSQAEYGLVDGVIDDHTRFLPVTSYGTAKLSAGLLSRTLCEQYGIVHIWGRVFSVYGPHDNEGTMLDYAIKQFQAGQMAMFSSATQMWNYLYESDAGMIFYLLGEKGKKTASYRIAHSVSRPLRDYVTELSKVMNTESLCCFSNESVQDFNYGIETTDGELFRDIEFTPQVSFEEGIKKMIARRTAQA